MLRQLDGDNSDEVMDDARIRIAQNMCWFFYRLTQTELRSCHMDLTPLESYYIILVPALQSRFKITNFANFDHKVNIFLKISTQLIFVVQAHPSGFCI